MADALADDAVVPTLYGAAGEGNHSGTLLSVLLLRPVAAIASAGVRTGGQGRKITNVYVSFTRDTRHVQHHRHSEPQQPIVAQKPRAPSWSGILFGLCSVSE